MKTLILIALLSIGFTTQAQIDYNFAIGLRGGETSGITFKKSLGSSSAMEFIAGAWRFGFSVTGLYEKNQAVFNTSGFNFYYGVGGHVAFSNPYYTNYYYNRRYVVSYYHDGGVGLGVDGIVGLEYKFNKIPLAVSADLKPFVELNTRGGMWTSLDPGIGIKVTL